MVFRKHNSTAGFSLIEVLVAITILGLVVVPIGSSLVLSFRLNARSEDMLQAQLAVSSAVETIMAEGYEEDLKIDYDRFSVIIEEDDTDTSVAHKIDVKVVDNDDESDIWFAFSTYARPAPNEGGEDEE